MTCGGGKGGKVPVDASDSINLVAAGSGGARIDLLGINGVVGAAVAGAAAVAVAGADAVVAGAVIAAADALLVGSGRIAEAAG